MEPQYQSLFDAVLALPEAERILLVQRLLDSLPPTTEIMQEDELETELDRRYEEIEQGQAGLVPWSELKDQS
ncbi:MAG: addiction module protein [Planctomycetes bacterium]|nr:addiction module protein [Planctomycetota bacterium]